MSEKIPVYNRAQRRQLAKKLHVSSSKIKEWTTPKISDIQWTHYPKGTKVKLNIERILSHEGLSDKYIEWVNEHKDQEFTVFQEEGKENSDIYCLNEDDNDIKWTFDISDLELISMPNIDHFEIGDTQVNSTETE